jgi:hypothetical protein
MPVGHASFELQIPILTYSTNILVYYQFLCPPIFWPIFNCMKIWHLYCRPLIPNPVITKSYEKILFSGHYQPKSGGTSCQPCPVGEFSRLFGLLQDFQNYSE